MIDYIHKAYDALQNRVYGQVHTLRIEKVDVSSFGTVIQPGGTLASLGHTVHIEVTDVDTGDTYTSQYPVTSQYTSNMPGRTMREPGDLERAVGKLVEVRMKDTLPSRMLSSLAELV